MVLVLVFRRRSDLYSEFCDRRLTHITTAHNFAEIDGQTATKERQYFTNKYAITVYTRAPSRIIAIAEFVAEFLCAKNMPKK